MSMKKNFSISVGIGAPSLITIFLVLSLVSFSVLSYMTARADYHFATNFQERSIAFYEANNKAEITVAKIQNLLLETYQESNQNNNQEYYLANVQNAITAHMIDVRTGTLTQTTDGTTGENMLIYSFVVTIRDTLELHVSLQIAALREDFDIDYDRLFTITQWQVIQTMEWEPDNHLNLL